MIRFHYDKKIDALYIRFDESRYSDSDEVAEGVVFDYNEQGRMVGLEILDASKKLTREFKNQFSGKRMPAIVELDQRQAVMVK